MGGTRNIFAAGRGRGLGLAALAVAALPGAALADQLMAVTYQDNPAGEASIIQPTPDVTTPTPPTALNSPPIRVSSALPTKEGTDLLLLGSQGCTANGSCTSPTYARVGRLMGSATWGNFQGVVSGPLSKTASGTVDLPAGAWLDQSQRQVVVADGTGTLEVYDALLGMAPWTNAPLGFTGPWQTLPAPSSIQLGGNIERVVVAADGTIYGASSGGANANTLFRATPTSTMDQCPVAFAGGGITDLALSPDGGTLVAGATDNNGYGHLAFVTWPAGQQCNMPLEVSASEMKAPFASVLIPPDLPWQVFTTRTNGEVQQWSQSGGEGATISLLGQPGALVAQPAGLVLSGEPPLPLVADVGTGFGGYLLPSTSVQQPQQLSFAGSMFSPGAMFGGQPARLLLRGTAPAFVVDTSCAGCTGTSRTVDLSKAYLTAGATTGTRVSFLPITGGANQSLKLSAGTCTSTTVIEAYATAATPSQLQIGNTCTANSGCASDNCVTVGRGQVCAPLLGPQQQSVTFTARPESAGSQDAYLAFAQLGAGENCQMTLAQNPGGGGAVIQVNGSALGSQALALVLDRSGSMLLPVGGTGPNPTQTRQLALTNAVTQLLDTVALLPDAGQVKVVVVPYDDQSNYQLAVMCANSAYCTGSEVTTAGNQSAILAGLTPQGSTNIRGALLTAAQRLNAVPTVGTPSSTVLLMTDGLHNTVGTTSENSVATMPDDVTNLWQAASDLSGGPGLARVSQLYSVALSVDATGIDSLKQLMSQFYDHNTTTPNPQGFLDYADDGAALSMFFNKVLWNYLGATSMVDPLVKLLDGQPPYTPTIDLTYLAQPVIVNHSLSQDGEQLPVDGRDQELIVVVTWQDLTRFPQVSLTYTNAAGAQAGVQCNTGAHLVTCYLPLSQMAPGTKPTLTVAKSLKSPSGELDVVVEAAARSPLRLRAAADRLEYYSGQTMNLQASLAELGLPLTGATVTGTIVMPSGALGTALANAPVSAAQITGLLKSQADLTAAAAKLHLMSPGLIPGTGQQTISFFDDGQHGDGAAGDGVYGAQVAAPLPGDYKLTVQASYSSRFYGAGSRQTFTSIRVGVGLDGKRSLLNVLAYSPPTGSGKTLQPGTLVAWLKPQDAAGNLLGPGNGNSIVFKQNGAPLPATHDEPGDLDGTYTVVVTGIGPGGPVTLAALGGPYVVVPKPGEAGGGLNGGGCGCRSVAAPAALPGPAAALALLGLALLLRRRRRA